jgi:hypothetical protein
VIAPARPSALLLFCRRAFIGIVATYVIASLSLGGTDFARPAFWSAAALWCAGVLWLPRHGASNECRAWHVLEVIFFNATLTLVLAEAALRGFAAFSGTSPLISDTLEAYLLKPGQDYGGGLRGNQLGYPGSDFQHDKQPGVTRIAALGDSFAVGPVVPFAENYLTLLEKALPGTQVYNFGVSGTGPREYLSILRGDVLPLRPDFVLVNVFVGNDITEIMATPRHLDPRQNLLYLLLTRSGKLLAERWRQKPTEWDVVSDRTTAGMLSEKSFQALEAKRLAVCLKSPPASLESKWQRAQGYLGLMIDECRRQQLGVAFVLIPDEFQVNPAVLADAVAGAGMPEEAFDVELPQRRLRNFFAERGVACLDLRPAFLAQPDTYALRDTHWNVRGNRLAAQCISAWLADLLARDISPPACAPPRPVP